MKRLWGAGALARLRGSGIRLRDGRGDQLLRRERRLFAGGGARATRVLLVGLIFLPALAHAYAGPGAGFAVLSSFWAIFVAFLYSSAASDVYKRQGYGMNWIWLFFILSMVAGFIFKELLGIKI